MNPTQHLRQAMAIIKNADLGDGMTLEKALNHGAFIRAEPNPTDLNDAAATAAYSALDNWVAAILENGNTAGLEEKFASALQGYVDWLQLYANSAGPAHWESEITDQAAYDKAVRITEYLPTIKRWMADPKALLDTPKPASFSEKLRPDAHRSYGADTYTSAHDKIFAAGADTVIAEKDGKTLTLREMLEKSVQMWNESRAEIGSLADLMSLPDLLKKHATYLMADAQYDTLAERKVFGLMAPGYIHRVYSIYAATTPDAPPLLTDAAERVQGAMDTAHRAQQKLSLEQMTSLLLNTVLRIECPIVRADGVQSSFKIADLEDTTPMMHGGDPAQGAAFHRGLELYVATKLTNPGQAKSVLRNTLQKSGGLRTGQLAVAVDTVEAAIDTLMQEKGYGKTLAA